MAVSDVLITKLNALEAIAAQLGIDFNGNTEQIHEAIAELKMKARFKPNDEEKSGLIDEIREAIAEMLGVKFTGNTDDIYEAIAKLKSYNELNSQVLEEIAKQLGFDHYSDNEQVMVKIGELIDNQIPTPRNEPENFDLFKENINAILGFHSGLFDADRVLLTVNGLKCDRIRTLKREGILKALGFALPDTTDFEEIAAIVSSFKQSDSKSEAKVNPLGDLPKRLAIALNLGNVFDDDDILQAIANLKHSLQLSQNEVKELQEKVAGQWNRIVTLEDESRSLRNHPLPQRNLIAQVEALKADLEAIARHLLIKFTGDTNEIHGAITDLIKYSLRDSDRDELQSERNYYRGILDKLCDRLGLLGDGKIELLEIEITAREMNLDFTSQHNEELLGKLVNSQAMALKYLNRIVELEGEVRSLQEPVNTVGRGDRDDAVDSFRYFASACNPNVVQNFKGDRLTTPEYIQVIRILLKAA